MSLQSKFNTYGTLNNYGIPPELQYIINTFASDKEPFNKVLEQLLSHFNYGLWWLSSIPPPEPKEAMLAVHKCQPPAPPPYCRNQVQFLDTEDQEDICAQAILRELTLQELLDGFYYLGDDNYCDDYDQYLEQESEPDTFFDPFCSDNLYN